MAKKRDAQKARESATAALIARLVAQGKVRVVRPAGGATRGGPQKPPGG